MYSLLRVSLYKENNLPTRDSIMIRKKSIFYNGLDYGIKLSVYIQYT